MTILPLGGPAVKPWSEASGGISWEQGANTGRRVHRLLTHRLLGNQQRISPGTPERASSPIDVEWRMVLA